MCYQLHICVCARAPIGPSSCRTVVGSLLISAALSSQDGLVGIATHYRLDGLGIESQWEQGFLHMSTLCVRPA
jgi:hypothetical protein